MSVRACVPELRPHTDREIPGAGRDSRRAIPSSEVQELPPHLYDSNAGPDASDSREDVGTDGAANALLWRDAVERGYIDQDSSGDAARRGYRRYLRDIGVMSEGRYRTIEKHELTGVDFARMESGEE